MSNEVTYQSLSDEEQEQIKDGILKQAEADHLRLKLQLDAAEKPSKENLANLEKQSEYVSALQA